VELILIRHAQPLAQETHDGRPADPELSERGVEQSHAVAAWLAKRPVDRLLASPARRALQTADVAARRLGLEVVIDERLRDANPENTRYVPLEEERARDPAAYRARLRAYRETSGWVAVSERVNEAFGEWTGLHPGGRIVAFCHGSVVNVFAAGILGLTDSIFLDADYASAQRFMISRKGVRTVKSLNESGYL
jgi:broad specificity phosphatase PhoE